MELQKFIDTNTNYTSLLKELNLKFKKYSELGLLIISYKYNVEYDFDKYPFIKWCRGAIIRLSDNKVICLPPQKALTRFNLSESEYPEDDNYILQPFIDGTMVNLFFHNSEWILSTRNFIGAKNKWDGNLSFKKMFDSIVKEKNIEFNILNKENSYTFVLQHKDNRIISEIVDNNIILVDEYSVKEDKFLDLDTNFKSSNIEYIRNNDHDVLKKSLNKSFNYQFKGFTLKYADKRVNYINSEYDNILSLKNECNYNNKLLTFLYLRNNNKLSFYLKHFRNDEELFDSYRNKVFIMKNELHNCYSNYFIKKSISKKDIPYHLKPLIYDLHTLYKKQGTKITISVVNDYIYNLPIKRLCFVINYYLM